MRDVVWQHLRGCQQCIRHGSPTTKVGVPLVPIITTAPRDLLCLDIIPMPYAGRYRYMLLAIDHFSKFVFAHPVTAARTAIIIRFVSEVFSQVGRFQQILTDPGPQFRSGTWRRFARQHGVSLSRSGRRHFEGNGCLERVVRTISDTMARMGATEDSWHHVLPRAVVAYNKRPHGTTGAEPHAIFFQVPVRLELDRRYGTHGPPPPTKASTRRHTEQQSAVWQRRSERRHPRALLPGDPVYHVPRLDSEFKHAAGRRFWPKRSGPYFFLERYPRQQLLCTDGVRQLLLPAWEVQQASSALEPDIGVVMASEGSTRANNASHTPVSYPFSRGGESKSMKLL
jgi:hypothetical protein